MTADYSDEHDQNASPEGERFTCGVSNRRGHIP
jgi:hypothetical protein